MNQFCWPVVQSDSPVVQSPTKGSASHEKASKSTLHKDKIPSKTAFASSKEQEEMEEQLPSFTTPHDSVTNYLGVFLCVCMTILV